VAGEPQQGRVSSSPSEAGHSPSLYRGCPRGGAGDAGFLRPRSVYRALLTHPASGDPRRCRLVLLAALASAGRLPPDAPLADAPALRRLYARIRRSPRAGAPWRARSSMPGSGTGVVRFSERWSQQRW
jgi:hypothetical protein